MSNFVCLDVRLLPFLSVFEYFKFIADLRRGTVMPLVLPFSEEPQFEELVSRGVKKEEIDFDSEQMDAETPSENEVQNEK